MTSSSSVICKQTSFQSIMSSAVALNFLMSSATLKKKRAHWKQQHDLTLILNREVSKSMMEGGLSCTVACHRGPPLQWCVMLWVTGHWPLEYNRCGSCATRHEAARSDSVEYKVEPWTEACSGLNRWVCDWVFNLAVSCVVWFNFQWNMDWFFTFWLLPSVTDFLFDCMIHRNLSHS